jgi:hypothetical protein
MSGMGRAGASVPDVPSHYIRIFSVVCTANFFCLRATTDWNIPGMQE